MPDQNDDLEIPMEVAKEDFAKLKDFEKKFYKEVDGVYKLKIKGYEEPSELLRAKNRETAEAKRVKEENAKLKKQLEDIEKAKEDANNEATKAKGSKEENDKLWQKKVEALEAKYEADKAKLRNTAEKGEIERVVSSFASKWLSDASELGSLAIRSRVRVEYEGDEAKLVFLDKQGNKTLQTLEEFTKNIFDDPSLKPIIKANSSSGGGASHNSPGSTSVDIKKMTGLEMVKLANENPSLYQEIISKQNSK